MSKNFAPYFSPVTVSEENGKVIVENEFVRWEHDPARGGELSGAFVRNGSNENLLAAPQSSALCPWVRGGWRQYHRYETALSGQTKVTAAPDGEGGCNVSYASVFTDADGAVLESAKVAHTVHYRASGAADHAVAITLDRDIDLGNIRIGTLQLRDDMDRLAVRPCSLSNWAVELQNPCRWIDLRHGKSRSDLPAYCSRFLPLSVLFVKNGVEAIEMSMGDDLGAWDGIGNAFPGLSQGSVWEARDPWRYEAVFAPLDSPRAGNIVKAGTYTFTYRLSLPFVRKNIVPLSVAGAFIKAGVPFEDRWPTAEELGEYASLGMNLLRVHNDGDTYGNGIFWKDVSYPPYPADEMAKMDKAIAEANDAGISVVPYFSCKEWHPDAGNFKALGERCTRRVVAGERFMETFFGTTLFGIQMCLESEWLRVRRDSIAQVLANHAFSGLYYDWCMGLECINDNHNGGKRHWDNDKLLELLEWSRSTVDQAGNLYLHLTNVPSLAIENLGNMILTEESEYYEIFPEMFTPHVHFLNIAPRSICVMLPAKEQTPQKMRALALAALLHHATLCLGNGEVSRDVLRFYKAHEADFASFTAYERHFAPGEGVTTTDQPRDVGLSVYLKGNEGLGLLANLTDTPRRVKWSVTLDGRKICGEAEVPPLDYALIPFAVR